MTSISVFKILKRSLQLEVILFLYNESSSFPSKTTGSNQSNYSYLSFVYHRSPSSWLQSAHLWLNSDIGLSMPRSLWNAQFSSFLGP